MNKVRITMMAFLMGLFMCLTGCEQDPGQPVDTQETQKEETSESTVEDDAEEESEDVPEDAAGDVEDAKDDATEDTNEVEPEKTSDVRSKKSIYFETKDLDGNVVTSDELFSKYDVVMVNVWATWCYWCVQELPDLEELNNELSGKNCAIVGLLGDGEDKQTIAYGKKLLKEAGCTYLCLLPFDGWEDIFDMNSGWPTSFFFNSKGEMAADPVIGASPEAYRKRIKRILKESASKENDSKEGTSGKTDLQSVKQNNAKAYRVYVVDQKAAPVVGARVQFCTDDTCIIGTTDETGAAIFEEPEGVYQVHILKIPDGYLEDDTVYEMPDKYSDMTIVLKKSKK